MAIKTFWGLLPSVKLPIEKDQLKITENLAIRKIPLSIKNICADAWKEPDPFFLYFTQNISIALRNTTWCVTCDYEVPDEGDMKWDKRHAQIKENEGEALEALALLYVLAAITYHLNLYPIYLFRANPDGIKPHYRLSPPVPPLPHPLLEYRFWRLSMDPSELKELMKLKDLYPKFYMKYHSQEGQRFKFFIAVNILYTALLEEKVDIALVLLVTSLEGLFLEGSGENKYRLASRVASFLGKNKEYKDREQIYQHVGKAYNLRSQVVHGTDKPINKKELALYYRLMREYVCDSLLRFLKDEEAWKTLELNTYGNFLTRLSLGESDPLVEET